MLDGLKVTNLSLTRGERCLFRGLDLTLQGGEALVLTGANGAGKTSLLRAVAGFIRPDAGEIAYARSGAAIEPETARQHDIHMLGHLEGLKAARTAAQELVFQTTYLGGTEESAMAAAERLRLMPLLDLETRRLSAGQKRRLSFARLLGAPRGLWLLDEPLAPLDAQWREEVCSLMREHLHVGGMIIAAVHDPLPAATRHLDLGLLERGQM